MGKWDRLIRKLGGVPIGEVKGQIDHAFLMGKLSRKPVQISRSIEFYVNETPNWEDEEIAKRALSLAITENLEEQGFLVFAITRLPNQDGKPVKKFRMTGQIRMIKEE